jgi:hypothetical protein
MVILGSRNNNSYYYYYISFFRAYLVTILKALEVCCVLVKPSKRIKKFKQLRESVRKRRRKKGRQWPCRLQGRKYFHCKIGNLNDIVVYWSVFIVESTLTSPKLQLQSIK